MVLILVCVAGRGFLAEVPFRQSPIQISELLAYRNRGRAPSVSMVNWQEMTRVSLATVLLAAGGGWLLAGAIEGLLRVRHRWLAVVLLGFSSWSFASAWWASDARSAWIVWLEQVSLLAAGFVMIQVCDSRRRFVFAVSVLAAVGLSLAIKGGMQIAWEQADTAAMFRHYGPQRLAELGMSPDDPKTRAYLQRIFSPAPTGYFGLANVLAAGLTLALGSAIGLTVAKALYARYRRRIDGALPPGHIRAASTATLLTALSIVPVAVILACTRSRGGVGAAVGVLVVTLLGLRFRAILARRWKRTVVAVGVLIALGVGGLVAYGLAKDRLPGGKTMSIRWFYWTGSAEIVREHPFRGVGPGNFSRAYLRHRRAEAEEAVKTPHNFIAHALTQYGLPGGALWLMFLGGMIVLAWKPATCATEMPGSRGTRRSVLIPAGCVVLGVLLCRTLFGEAAGSPLLLILEGFVPAALFALALTVERWFGGPPEDLPDGAVRAIRIAVAAGCSAMVLHNFVSFSLWTPGTAGLFWTAVGAAVAMGTTKGTSLRRLAVPMALLGVVGVVLATMLIVTPVAKRLRATRNVADAILHRQRRTAVAEAQRAARADPLDAYAAMNVSRLILISGPARNRTNTDGIPLPLAWAQEAIRRNDSAQTYRLAAQVCRDLKLPEAEEYWRGAMQRDPADARLRLDYAVWLIEQDHNAEAEKKLNEAQRIDRELRNFNPESVYLFSEREQKQIDALRKKIRKE